MIFATRFHPDKVYLFLSKTGALGNDNFSLQSINKGVGFRTEWTGISPKGGQYYETWMAPTDVTRRAVKPVLVRIAAGIMPGG